MNLAFLQKAETGVKSAKVLLDLGDTDGACSRAYYAMFDAARVAFAWAGVVPERGTFKSHGGLLSAFGLHLVKPGLFPAEPGRAIQRVQTLRQLADYEATPAFWRHVAPHNQDHSRRLSGEVLPFPTRRRLMRPAP